MKMRKDVLIARLVLVVLIVLVIGIIASIVTRIASKGSRTDTAVETTEAITVDDSEYSEIVVETGNFDGEDKYVKTTSSVNIRDAAENSATVIATLPSNTVMKLLSESQAGWAKVSYEETVGYVRTDYIEETEIDPATIEPEEDYTLMTATDNIILRNKPSKEGDMILTVSAGTEVKVYETTEDGWARVYANGSNGYLFAQYLK